jgi:hypothetical protein
MVNPVTPINDHAGSRRAAKRKNEITVIQYEISRVNDQIQPMLQLKQLDFTSAGHFKLYRRWLPPCNQNLPNAKDSAGGGEQNEKFHISFSPLND